MIIHSIKIIFHSHKLKLFCFSYLFRKNCLRFEHDVKLYGKLFSLVSMEISLTHPMNFPAEHKSFTLQLLKLWTKDFL